MNTTHFVLTSLCSYFLTVVKALRIIFASGGRQAGRDSDGVCVTEKTDGGFLLRPAGRHTLTKVTLSTIESSHRHICSPFTHYQLQCSVSAGSMKSNSQNALLQRHLLAVK